MTHVEILNGDNFAQMLRDGFTDDYCHDSQLGACSVSAHLSQITVSSRVGQKRVAWFAEHVFLPGSGSNCEVESHCRCFEESSRF